MTYQMHYDIRDLTKEERLDWLRLARTQGLGAKTFLSLIHLHGSPTKAIAEIPHMALRGGKKRVFNIPSRSAAEKEWRDLAKIGGTLLMACDRSYPNALRHLNDIPPVLTCLGNPEILSTPMVAMVGARNASANGCRFGGTVAKELGEAGYTVISGLARGIDTAIHHASVSAGTIAVLAGGIDHIYPPENRDLYHAIVENGGAIITEMPLHATPKGHHFPRRNRIISVLALGTIVVEANHKSGSLITARYALEQNKELFAVPGSPLDPRCAGTNDLLRQGAHLATSTKSVLDVLDTLRQQWDSLFEKDTNTYQGTVNRHIDKALLDTARPKIHQALSPTPTAVDDLIQQLGFSAPVIWTILLELELAGRLERHRGNQVALVYEVESLFA